MPKNRTPEEIALIRPAFNAHGRIGIFESIVLTGYEKTRNITVDVSDLKEAYSKSQCPNVAKLIEYLATEGAEIQEIGSGSIDVEGVTKGEFSMESALQLQELYIGNPRRNIRPLQWLTYLAIALPDILPEQRQVFDEICNDLYVMSTATTVINSDIF